MSISGNVDLSVVLSTYNRCDILPAAVESLLSQHAPGLHYEIIIVDNNSTDCTRKVVESFIRQVHPNLRYVFEAKQGLSHARNAGLANARGAIIAFTDDDVRAERDWIANIKRAFDSYTDVDCVGGKILPKWNSEPPSWLTRDHWIPLALQDYGNLPLYATAERPLCLAGANLSFRREVFKRIALFSPAFRRAQDIELLLRFWRAGGRAIYVPDVVVTADVQDERLTKPYHRKWHATNGSFNSLMRLAEFIGPEGQVMKNLPRLVKLFDAPAFMYRQLMTECIQWLVATVRGRESLAFKHGNHVRYLTAYLGERYEHEFRSRKKSHLLEVTRFIKAMLHKKIYYTFAGLSRGN